MVSDEKHCDDVAKASLPSWYTVRANTTTDRRRQTPSVRVTKRLLPLLYIGACIYALTRMPSLTYKAQQYLTSYVHADEAPSELRLLSDECPQVDAWRPNQHSQLFQHLDNASGLPSTPPPEQLATLLSGAVQVNTSTYDDYPLPVSADPGLWNAVFAPFREYLYKAFPEVHFSNAITLQHVNEHGLLYTWHGKNKALKPIVFMAHQDVVPVEPETLSLWEHGAFSGYIDYDKGLVYGRGASDDKASLTMLLAAFTSLLKSGFKPERTIILSFGFDEETSGTQGAQALAERLESIYGTHADGKGAWMIVDEGNGVDADAYGLTIAGPAVAEKGYLDVRIVVHAPGGHSSVPPQHTTIGILSRIVTAIEDAPWQGTVSIREQTGREDSPGLRTLLCLRDAPDMRHGKKNKVLRNALDDFVAARASVRRAQCDHDRPCRNRFVRALRTRRQALSRDRLESARAQLERVLDRDTDFVTTQAVDLISGGVKINALPEQASVVINHRINVEQSVSDVRKHLQQIVVKVAHKHGYQVKAWNSSATQESASDGAALRYIELKDAFDSALEPAPRTPTEGKDAAPFRLLSSVIRHTYEEADRSLKRPMRIVPTLMGGNTDTKSYWRLSRHIFRFAPGTLKPLPKGQKDEAIHTVNEIAAIDSLTVSFRFYTAMMVAAQDEERN